MLRAAPEPRPVVLNGAIVATSAEACFAERFQSFPGQEGRIEEHALADVTDGAFLLVERRPGVPRIFREEGEEEDGDEEESFQSRSAAVNRRFPA